MEIFSCQVLILTARRAAAILVLAGLIIGGMAPSGIADQIIPQKLIAHSASDQATLGWPRWKGYISADNPDNVWISYANSSGSAPNLSYSTNGGATWNSNVIQINFDG